MTRKTVRFLVLTSLLVAAGDPARGQIQINFNFGGGGGSKVAKKLAQEMAAVRQRFGDQRAALPAVPGPGGTPAYPRQTVLDLIDGTRKDLDQAISRVQEPKLVSLEAWANEEIEGHRHRLDAPPKAARTAPRSGVVFAAYFGAGAPAQPDPVEATTVGTAEAQSVLDRVGKVLERLFFLADKDDLEVRLWVGSTPAQSVQFRFWPKAAAKRAAEPTILKTNGKQDHVTRGLYAYTAARGSGAVTEIIASDKPDGSAARDTERLDLVNGSLFFCCEFEGKYCHHVANEKECRAERH